MRSKRLSLGLSYRDLARFLGVSERSIRLWETNQGHGNEAFSNGSYDGEIHPLLQLLPHIRGAAHLPTELKQRLLNFHPLLSHPNPHLLEQIRNIQKETLTAWFAEASKSKEIDHVH